MRQVKRMTQTTMNTTRLSRIGARVCDNSSQCLTGFPQSYNNSAGSIKTNLGNLSRLFVSGVVELFLPIGLRHFCLIISIFILVELPLTAANTFSSTGSLATGRSSHATTLLSNGKVLVTGGSGSGGVLASAELYNPATGTWTATGALAAGRDEVARHVPQLAFFSVFLSSA